jgi:hypothetical protein
VAAEVASATTVEPLLDRFATLLGTGLAGVDTSEVLTALGEGAVFSLLVAGTAPWWAHWPDSTERLDEREPGAVDLVNLAVTDALRTHAAVHLVPPGRLPDGVPFGALYRY